MIAEIVLMILKNHKNPESVQAIQIAKATSMMLANFGDLFKYIYFEKLHFRFDLSEKKYFI